MTTPHDGHIRCSDCAHSFVGPAVYEAHRNTFPPGHPLRRCLDVTEMQALDYVRRASGAWASDSVTQLYPSQARRLATARQQIEHYELTGEVSQHERLVPAPARMYLRAERESDSALSQPERTPVRPPDAERRREKTRLRVRRYRCRRGDVTLPISGHGSVTSGRRTVLVAA